MKSPQPGTLPSTLLCYGNAACWTRKSSQRAALCFVSAYTIAKTVMLSSPFPEQEATVLQLLCLVPGGAAEGVRVCSCLASHLSEQRHLLDLPYGVSANRGYLSFVPCLLLFTSLWLS